MILCSNTDAELDTNQFVLDATCLLLSRYKIVPSFISINIISEKRSSDRGLTRTSRSGIHPVDWNQTNEFLGLSVSKLILSTS